MQLRVHVLQLGSGAAEETNKYLKNKSLALKVGSVMERKRVWNFHQGSTTDWSLVLNYFRPVCTEVMLMLNEFFSSYNFSSYNLQFFSSYTRVCGHVHMQRRKIIWFFYAVMMLAAETVVGWRQQDDSEVV